MNNTTSLKDPETSKEPLNFSRISVGINAMGHQKNTETLSAFNGEV